MPCDSLTTLHGITVLWGVEVTEENEKYVSALKKIALGFEYEEVQTMIEETPNGQKKKIIRIKKQALPNYNALLYFIGKNKKNNTDIKEIEKAMSEFEMRFDNGDKENKD